MKDTRISLLAGFVAGIAEVLVGYPFDTVKTRLQIQDPNSTPPLLRTPWGCAAGMWKEEGPLSFYRGIVAPMIQEALGVAILFGARDWLRNNTGADISRPGAFILACCLIGLLESLIYCPLDHLKARMQALGAKEKERMQSLPAATQRRSKELSFSFQPSPSPRSRGIASLAQAEAQAQMEELMRAADEEEKGSMGKEVNLPSPKGGQTKEALGDLACVLLCAQAVVRARGLVGLYLGFFLQAAKEMLGNIALFGTYDVALAALSGPAAKAVQVGGQTLLTSKSWLAIVPAGSLAGMAYSTLSYPLDTIKSKLQTDSLSSPKYKGSLHCIKRVAFHEVVSVTDLFRGLSMCLIRAIPGCAIQFFVFELVFKALSDFSDAHFTSQLHHWQILDLLSGWS